MSPRPYNLGLRKAAIDETRGRIVRAAREVLGDPQAGTAFTIDAVARRADVARMTVYYQFESKQGLLEAVYDDLAARGLVARLPALFNAASGEEALRELFRAFYGFWATDRLVERRARALALLDAEIERGVRARDERRRGICRNVMGRIAAEAGSGASAAAIDGAVDLLFTLTSFETFDTLATAGRSVEDCVGLILPVATAASRLT